MKIVSLGGGGGHAQALKAVKTISNVDEITAITLVSDRGGSTKILREEFGCLGHIGDATKCVAALSDDPLWAQALLYRFPGTSIHPHSMKNLVLVALEKTAEAFGIHPDEALECLCRISGILPNRVIIISRHFAELRVKHVRGHETEGESMIDNLAKTPKFNMHWDRIAKVYLDPPIPASPAALDAIVCAHIILIPSGDLFTSIYAALLPQGVREAILASRAKVIQVVNIMTKNGETQHYTASDFVDKISDAIGRMPDKVIYDTSAIPKEVLNAYFPDEKVKLGGLANYIGSRRLEKSVLIKAPVGMVTKEGRICHDPELLGKVLARIFANIPQEVGVGAFV